MQQLFTQFCLISANDTNMFVPKWDWHNYFQVRLAQCRSSHRRCYIKNLLWEVLQNSQENTFTRDSFFKKVADLRELAWFFPGDSGTIVPNWDCYDCSQVTLARLFLRDTGTIAPKWDWHSSSQVKLSQIFPGDTGKIVPKWN